MRRRDKKLWWLPVCHKSGFSFVWCNSGCREACGVMRSVGVLMLETRWDSYVQWGDSYWGRTVLWADHLSGGLPPPWDEMRTHSYSTGWPRLGHESWPVCLSSQMVFSSGLSQKWTGRRREPRWGWGKDLNQTCVKDRAKAYTWWEPGLE